MGFKRGDKVIVAGVRDTAIYGRMATVIRSGAVSTTASIDGEVHTIDTGDLALVPDSVIIDTGDESDYYWCVDIDRPDREKLELAFESEPNVNWGNGCLRVEGDNETYIVPVTGFELVHITRRRLRE